MNQQIISLIAFISPAVFTLVAIVSWLKPGIRPLLVKRLGTVATLIGIGISAICSVLVFNHGLLETSLLGINNLGFSLRLDSLSVIMFFMIALLSFVIVRFSANYLDGDKRQGAFIGRLAATIASVQLLVLSGNIVLLFASWVLTSISLHRLLIFYKERPGAISAARKKYIMARLGDVSLFAAIVLLYNKFETGNLEVIFQSINNSLQSGEVLTGLEPIAFLIAGAAILKSAQFPTHGWLVEVMETPTPVSALLHAGLLNAGPFLILRMAFIMDASFNAPLLLIIVGAFTALFGSVVYLTQTSIKTALGYSSIAHMGFSLMVCGMGVYPAAMLHLVAHSFYKAHSFLSSGSVIDVIRTSKITKAIRAGSPLRIAVGIILAILVYSGFAILWGIDPQKDFALMAIGAIIIMGLARIFTSAIDSNISFKLLIRASVICFVVATAFFTLETGTQHLLSDQLPHGTVLNSTEVTAISVILLIFAITVFIQIISPRLKANATITALGIHLRNGLYANAYYDKIIDSIYAKKDRRLKGSDSEPKDKKAVAKLDEYVKELA